MVLATGGLHEHGLVAHAVDDLESERLLVEGERAIDVGDVEDGVVEVVLFVPSAGTSSGIAELRASSSRLALWLTASMLRVIFTWSPTTTPPASMAPFQFTPKSLRLIFVVAVKPARSPPQGSLARPSNSTSRTTGFVTSRMVRSPVSFHSSPSLCSIFVPRKQDLRELLRVEEVVRAKVLVTLLGAGVDAGDVDSRRDHRPRRVLLVDRKAAGEALEAALHGGDHQVLHGELGGRVARVDGPGADGLLLCWGRGGQCGGAHVCLCLSESVLTGCK